MNLYDMCLTENYDTDKYYTDKYFHSHSYIENFYNSKFQDRKNAKNILEIGVWTGGSLRLWRDFFTEATIFGIDIKLPDIDSDRIFQIKGDGYANEIINLFKDDFFDIIIDDGPHTAESQIIFVQKYFSKVKKGGLLICEDIASPITLVRMVQMLPQVYMDKVQILDLNEKDDRKDSRIFCVQK